MTGGTGSFQNTHGQTAMQLLHGRGNPARVTPCLLP